MGLSHENIGHKIAVKVTSPEKDYFAHFAMKYPLFVVHELVQLYPNATVLFRYNKIKLKM